nr:hypothetical protein [Tanacetum cinerariifolium]
MLNPKDITDPTTAMNMALALMAKAFKLNYSTPTNNNQRISSNPRNSKHRHRVLRLNKLPSMTQTDQLRSKKQLSKEKSTVSFLLEEKKKLKSDFKIHEDELLDKQIQLEKRIKELDNILVKTAKFVGDFKSLAKEVDESLAKYKALELEIERLLKAVVSQDIMSVVKNNSVGETLNL